MTPRTRSNARPRRSRPTCWATPPRSPEASPEKVEELAARATELAEKWGGEEDDDFGEVEVEEVDEALVDVD